MHLNLKNNSQGLILEPEVKFVLPVSKTCSAGLLMFGYSAVLKTDFAVSAFLWIVCCILVVFLKHSRTKNISLLYKILLCERHALV